MGKRILFSGPPGSGKSIEAFKLCSAKDRIFAITPFKADASEKYFDLIGSDNDKRIKFGTSNNLGSWNDSNVIKFFGYKTENFQAFYTKKFWLVGNHNKVFPLLMNEHKQLELDAIILDEIDYVALDELYEIFVSILLPLIEEWDADLYACSAVMSEKSLKTISQWLGCKVKRLSKEASSKIQNVDPPISKKEYLKNGEDLKNFIINLALELRLDPTLFFIPSKKFIEEIVEEFSTNRFVKNKKLSNIFESFPNFKKTSPDFRRGISTGVVFEHSNRRDLEKKLARDLFNRGYCNLLFATNTLERGVNVRAKNVVIIKPEFKHWYPNQIINMVGRSGRFKDEKCSGIGKVIFVSKEREYTKEDLKPVDIEYRHKTLPGNLYFIQKGLECLGYPYDVGENTLYKRLYKENPLHSFKPPLRMRSVAVKAGLWLQSYERVLTSSATMLTRVDCVDSFIKSKRLVCDYLGLKHVNFKKYSWFTQNKLKYAIGFLYSLANDLCAKTFFALLYYELEIGRKDKRMTWFIDYYLEKGEEPIRSDLVKAYREEEFDEGIKKYFKLRESGIENLQGFIRYKDLASQLEDDLRQHGKNSLFQIVEKYERSNLPRVVLLDVVKRYLERCENDK